MIEKISPRAGFESWTSRSKISGNSQKICNSFYYVSFFFINIQVWDDAKITALSIGVSFNHIVKKFVLVPIVLLQQYYYVGLATIFGRDMYIPNLPWEPALPGQRTSPHRKLCANVATDSSLTHPIPQT